jgi:hypothetical protein
MKTALVLLLSCAGLSLAQTTEAQTAGANPKPVVVKRLASVTWDLDTHKLVWVVQKGAEVNGEFVASSTDKYEVSPEEAFMASKDEKRGLGAEEAGSVVDLVNLLSLYCAQSTDWWEDGSAATETSAPSQNSKAPDTRKATPPSERPTRVGEPEQKPSPALLPGTLIAANSGSGK